MRTDDVKREGYKYKPETGDNRSVQSDRDVGTKEDVVHPTGQLLQYPGGRGEDASQ